MAIEGTHTAISSESAIMWFVHATVDSATRFLNAAMRSMTAISFISERRSASCSHHGRVHTREGHWTGSESHTTPRSGWHDRSTGSTTPHVRRP